MNSNLIYATALAGLAGYAEGATWLTKDCFPGAPQAYGSGAGVKLDDRTIFL